MPATAKKIRVEYTQEEFDAVAALIRNAHTQHTQTAQQAMAAKGTLEGLADVLASAHPDLKKGEAQSDGPPKPTARKGKRGPK